jgi:hypothetical protein
MSSLSPARHATVAALVRLLLPEPDARGVSRQVESDVVGFVTSQIEALPAFLGPPYRLAIAAFDWLPALRHGRRFTHLEASAARRWLSLWSDGPIPLARDFVKLVRSCALLAYYDHPEVAPGPSSGVGAAPAVGVAGGTA